MSTKLQVGFDEAFECNSVGYPLKHATGRTQWNHLESSDSEASLPTVCITLKSQINVGEELDNSFILSDVFSVF